MKTLFEEDVTADPFATFRSWYQELLDSGAPEPTAVSLATVGTSGQPSLRVVLLKGYDEGGFVFFTNYQSRKGRELAANPRAALNFFWVLSSRQVRIEGSVAKVSEAESDEYFASRPRTSQLGAWASAQSEVLPNRDALEAKLAAVESRFEVQEAVPRPPHWGGFRMTPAVFEFWQGRPDRLHDRLRYSIGKSGGWALERLSP